MSEKTLKAVEALEAALAFAILIALLFAVSVLLSGCVKEPELQHVEYSIVCDGMEVIDAQSGVARCEGRVKLVYDVGYVLFGVGSLIEHGDEILWCPVVELEGSGEVAGLGELSGRVAGLPPDPAGVIDDRCEEIAPPLRFTPAEGE